MTRLSSKGRLNHIGRATRTLAVALGIGLLTTFSPSCSSDDNGGTGGMVTIPCLAFQGAALPAPDTVVAQSGGSSTCDLMVVDLTVTDVNDLFAANFVVTYPSSVVRFSSASELGSVLAADGAALSLQSSETTLGNLTIGITRLNETTGVNAVGGNLLVRLNFVRAATSGSGVISFGQNELLDSSQPPAVIPGITWSGGNVTISQQ